MVKSTFQEVYDKTIKFYDFQYHLHKSSFKGLSSWMKDYSQCQKDYAQKMFKLSKDMVSYVPDMGQEMPAVKSSINDLIQCVSIFSQLHFNYSERLIQVSSALGSEYNSSKKLKEKHMKVLEDQFKEKLQTVRQSKVRSKITTQESLVCKSLFEHLDSYAEEEFARTQKFKEQILIYFALTKKIQEKQLEMTSKFKGKISQEEISVKISKIDEISELLRDQYNTFASGQNGSTQQLALKKYDRIQPVEFLRDSLKQSTILRQKVNNFDTFKNRITQSLKNYERIPQDYVRFNLIVLENNKTSGLFNRNILKKSQSYSNLMKNDILKKIGFNMLSSFYSKSKQPENRVILLTIKGNLKIGGDSINEHYKTLSQFIQKQLSKRLQMQIDPLKIQQIQEQTFHLAFLAMISELYFIGEEQFREKDSITEDSLILFLKNRSFEVISTVKHKNQLHINISSVIVKILLSATIIIQDDQPLLIDQFCEYLQFVEKFSVQFLQLNQNTVKLLFLDLVENSIRSTKSKYVEEIHLLVQNLQNNNKKSSRKKSTNQIHSKFQNGLFASVIVRITQGIISFYKLGIPLNNFFNILICLENFSDQKFSAVEYFHKCLKRAGFTYIFWVDEEKKIIEPAIWQGQMRLKNLVQTLETLEYEKLQETHFVPTAEAMTHILGVDQNVILKKMKEEFLESLGDIIEQNIDLLVTEQGVDKEGFILKLGVFLAKLNIPSFKSIQFQKKYFKVLDLYLTNTQKQYNTLLDHSRKTQLWIMQENTLATQNCIDFCSLLYKPFEFLLKTIKVLAQQNKTSFTNEFNQFIKNKLNTILKDQICKYINFLNDSLRQYYFEEPEIHYKPKKGENVLEITEDQTAKIKMLFKQIVRRLYNLNFLKQQLNEIIHDFLEEDVSQDLGQSIFNLSNLSKATTKYKQYKQILANLTDIVKTISEVEQKLIFRVSDITVFHCMRRLFYNLYFQEEKSAFQEFFSTKSDYKLSTYTFVRYQKEFQDMFNFIQKQIPSEIEQKYYQRLICSLFKALKFEILNSGKFKLPKSKQEIVRYLDQDSSFMCTLLKQKYISPQIIQKQLQRPLKKVFSSLQASTKDLIQKYEAQSLNNNNSECKYILIILYLRTNDQKAQQFFKKFKSMIFK